MNVEIAQRLAEMRREQGFSQEELAARLGLSRQAVSKWERAESSPDTGNLIALADLYGVTLDELVRVDTDIADDVTFEARDRSASAEVEAREAAVAASAAAATAAAAAATAQAAVRQEPTAAAAPQPSPSQTASAQPVGDPYATPQAAAFAAGTAPAPDSAPAAATAPVSASAPTPVPPVPPHGYPPPAQQPVYGAPVPPQPQQPVPAYGDHDGKHRRGPWSTFPYPILCVILFMLAGFAFGAWHPAWVLFLTIPLYYWIARIIENDPNYRAGRR